MAWCERGRVGFRPAEIEGVIWRDVRVCAQRSAVEAVAESREAGVERAPWGFGVWEERDAAGEPSAKV